MAVFVVFVSVIRRQQPTVFDAVLIRLRIDGVFYSLSLSLLQVLGSSTGFKGSALESSRRESDGDLERIPRTGSQVSGQRRLQISRGDAAGHGQTRSMDF